MGTIMMEAGPGKAKEPSCEQPSRSCSPALPTALPGCPRDTAHAVSGYAKPLSPVAAHVGQMGEPLKGAALGQETQPVKSRLNLPAPGTCPASNSYRRSLSPAETSLDLSCARQDLQGLQSLGRLTSQKVLGTDLFPGLAIGASLSSSLSPAVTTGGTDRVCKHPTADSSPARSHPGTRRSRHDLEQSQERGGETHLPPAPRERHSSPSSQGQLTPGCVGCQSCSCCWAGKLPLCLQGSPRKDTKKGSRFLLHEPSFGGQSTTGDDSLPPNPESLPMAVSRVWPAPVSICAPLSLPPARLVIILMPF